MLCWHGFLLTHQCIWQLYCVVLDAHQLMHHGLVGPLGEQRGDWVVLAVQQQDHRGAAAAKIKHLVLLLSIETGCRGQDRRSGVRVEMDCGS